MLAVGIIIGCVITAGSAQDAVDRQAAGIRGQSPEMHYYINGEEVDLEGMAGQDGAGQDDPPPQ